MLLAIDVGNTNIVLGVFDGDRLTNSWRLQTLRERTADELGILVTQLFGQSGVDKDTHQGHHPVVGRATADRARCRRWPSGISARRR